ncbi:MAG: NAD-dependent protein deacylase [Clostridiales bacterium]|jgi:NAD-dependent deacetylase|nr:NAD-dependent protein deacylase [Clostridiales bacterium]
MLSEKINQLKQWIRDSDNIVFFGGAGVSTESGIPDFRSVDGLYHLRYDYPPETILSHSFFVKKTEEFYKFYRDKMIYEDAKPNITHLKLAELESQGKIKAVVTQNIDGLHQEAGSKNVLELHGSVRRNYCMNCQNFFSIDKLKGTKGIPTCDCGGIVKPDVVLYEEGLDDTIVSKAMHAISQADVFIIGGTSLSVYPASGLIRYYGKDKMVLINKSFTPYDKDADLLIQAGLGEVFTKL